MANALKISGTSVGQVQNNLLIKPDLYFKNSELHLTTKCNALKYAHIKIVSSQLVQNY